jgi:hypothetical protein
MKRYAHDESWEWIAEKSWDYAGKAPVTVITSGVNRRRADEDSRPLFPEEESDLFIMRCLA